MHRGHLSRATLAGDAPDDPRAPVDPPSTDPRGEPLGVFNPYLRRAAWGGTGKSPACWPDGMVAPDDHRLFDGYTKTDFLWLIPARAH